MPPALKNRLAVIRNDSSPGRQPEESHHSPDDRRAGAARQPLRAGGAPGVLLLRESHTHRPPSSRCREAAARDVSLVLSFPGAQAARAFEGRSARRPPGRKHECVVGTFWRLWHWPLECESSALIAGGSFFLLTHPKKHGVGVFSMRPTPRTAFLTLKLETDAPEFSPELSGLSHASHGPVTGRQPLVCRRLGPGPGVELADTGRKPGA